MTTREHATLTHPFLHPWGHGAPGVQRKLSDLSDNG
jgi:hypothetical protein